MPTHFIRRRYLFITSERQYRALHRALLAAGAITVGPVSWSKPDGVVVLRVELPAHVTNSVLATRMYHTDWCGGEMT